MLRERNAFSDSLSKIQRVFFSSSSLSLVACRESLGEEIHCSICGVTVKKASFFSPLSQGSINFESVLNVSSL